MARNPTKSKPIKRVSKKEWFAMALDTLEKDGVEGVRIEKLARQLGIAKSGFYWHFKDRQDLLKQMLDYWVYEYTTSVKQMLEPYEGTPEQLLEYLMHKIEDSRLAKYDAVIFVWAQKDPTVRKIFLKAHKIRLQIIREIFSDLGFEGDELEMRTQLFVIYQSWEYTIFSKQPRAKKNKLLKLRLDLLTKN